MSIISFFTSNQSRSATNTKSASPTQRPAPSLKSDPVDSVSFSKEAQSLTSGLGNFLGGIKNSFGAGLGAPTVSNAEQKLADSNYAKNGDKKFDLSRPEQVKKLITFSPQIDGDHGGTTNDAKRCGGASIMNGLLADGNFPHNGAALSTLASETSKSNPKFEVSEKQKQALQAMQTGQMTPNHAAQLQELTYDLSKARSGQSHEGLNKEEISATLKDLRQYGAFGNTEEINLRRGDGGGNTPHWTMSSKTRDGRKTYADSNLNEKGQATVGGSDKARFSPSFEPSPDNSFFMDSITMKPDGLFSSLKDQFITRTACS